MVNPTVKIASIALGIGGIATGAGYGIYQMTKSSDLKENETSNLSTNNISKLSKKLTDEGFKLEITPAEWSSILSAYANTANKNIFENIDKTQLTSLQNKCKEVLNQDDLNYKLARRWCVKPETIKTILERNSKMLNTEAGIQNADNSEWKAKISSLTPDEKAKIKITTDTETTNLPLIKEKCRTLLEKKTIDPEFEENFDLLKKICTVEKAQ